MNVFVTGSKGFLGGKLVTHFQDRGHTVYHPFREELDLCDELAVEAFFATHDIDVVVHCAVAGRTDMTSQTKEITGEIVNMFRNLYAHKDKYKRLVNIASGYEYDHKKPVVLVEESELSDRLPSASYGLGKNYVSRIVRDTDNMYNLRLFGMFHEDESAIRFFKKLRTGTGKFTIDEDRQFDFVYLNDILPMIDLAVEGKLRHKDINLTYSKKYFMSELVSLFFEQTGTSREVAVNRVGSNHYTASGKTWSEYQYPRIGIQEAFRRYR